MKLQKRKETTKPLPFQFLIQNMSASNKTCSKQSSEKSIHTFSRRAS